jgi:ribosomal protein S18 acetylase RimI-like enzyme
MEVRLSRDKKEIYNFLSKSPDLQLYLIADLDDFFWPYTKWYALSDKGEIMSIALLYSGMDPATLLLFYDDHQEYARELIRKILPELPGKFNVHLSPGLIDLFGKENIIENYGQNLRMILTRTPEIIHDGNIRRLDMNDLNAMLNLYSEAYPGNWFDGRMVESGKYFGYFSEGSLVGVAGIHAWSAGYRIAALGNIATHPFHRGKQIAFKLTSALCCDLTKNADIVGLNVKSDNLSAISCYKKTGFEIRSVYDECLIRNIDHTPRPE